jgi:hypothetical protein
MKSLVTQMMDRTAFVIIFSTIYMLWSEIAFREL